MNWFIVAGGLMAIDSMVPGIAITCHNTSGSTGPVHRRSDTNTPGVA